MDHIVADSQILTALMACPCLCDFQFNYNLVPIGGKSNSFECGSIVHVFLEYYYGGLIKNLKRSDAIDDAFMQAKLYIVGCPVCKDLKATTSNEKAECGHRIGDFVGVRNTPRESGKQKLSGDIFEKDYIGWTWVLDTCQQYIDFYKSDSWTPLEVEVVKKEIIYKDDDIAVLWKAKLDWIIDNSQGIYPVDHKTMKARRDTLSLNNQFMGQAVLMKSSNVIINKIGFQTTLKPEEKFQRIMIPYSRERLFEWTNVIVPYYMKMLAFYIKENHWPRNFTHCENKYGFCQFKGVCESNMDMREEVIRANFIKGRIWDISND